MMTFLKQYGVNSKQQRREVMKRALRAYKGNNISEDQMRDLVRLILSLDIEETITEKVNGKFRISA